MSAFHISDKKLKNLLAEGQHSILYANSLSLNVPVAVKKAKQPDTEVTKALKRATRSRLQDAFINTWILLGGDRDAWIEEYMFHPTRKWRFDFANLEAKIAVECNGGQWTKSGHSSGRGLQRDAEKTNAANALGWTVYTLTTSMLSKREAIGNVAEILRVVKGGMMEHEELAIYCDGCGKGIDQDGDDYCTPHEEGCPNRDEEPGRERIACACSLHYHTECCPECNGKSQVEE